MAEEGEEKKAFTVTDRRFSKRDPEEPRTEPERPPEPEPSQAAREEPQKGPAASPQADFAGFILSLANTALINMGVAPDPMGGQPEVHLDGAEQMIDILGILQEKTQGNLTKEEEGLLDQILSELRMRYVEVARSGGGQAPGGT
ncbi:MAG: DUF1844 domain-containing protein [bacterium]